MKKNGEHGRQRRESQRDLEICFMLFGPRPPRGVPTQTWPREAFFVFLFFFSFTPPSLYRLLCFNYPCGFASSAFFFLAGSFWGSCSGFRELSHNHDDGLLFVWVMSSLGRLGQSEGVSWVLVLRLLFFFVFLAVWFSVGMGVGGGLVLRIVFLLMREWKAFWF